MGLKKVLTLLLLMVKNPFFWLCKAILYPLVGFFYWIYRIIKKLVLRLSEFMRDRAMGLLANRYAIHAIVIILAFAVTTTNLHAQSAPLQADNAAPQSILGTLTQSEEDAIVIEEAGSQNVNSSEGVAYLGSQALSSHDSAAQADQSGTDASSSGSADEEAYVDDASELELVSPTANAVRVQPEINGGETPSTRSKIETYVVEDGDSLGSIARKFGLRTETILASNGLSARSVIHPGETLKITPVDGIIYKVKSGDTVNGIAKAFDSDGDKIIDMNGLASGAALSAGQELILPDGKLPAPPPPKRPSRIATNIKNIFVAPPPSPDRDSGDDMVWPTAVRRITQYFGHYRGGTRHTGVDIAGPTGTPIYAAEDGVVAISSWNTGGYGNMVLINHGHGVFTRYGHASKLIVQAGDTVKKGDVIALMGTTGHSTGPHLHFEVMTGDPHHRVNPLDYVR